VTPWRPTYAAGESESEFDSETESKSATDLHFSLTTRMQGEFRTVADLPVAFHMDLCKPFAPPCHFILVSTAAVITLIAWLFRFSQF